MKKMIETFVCLVVLCGFSAVVLGQQSKPTVACDPKDQACLNEAADLSDQSQDLALDELQGQIKCLKQAQADFAQAAALKSATRRIAALEEFRSSLPEDLIGQYEIQILIDRAATATRADLDQTIGLFKQAVMRRIEDLEKKMAALEAKVKTIEEDVAGARNRVYHVEDRLNTVEVYLRYRSVGMELFGVGFASNGVLGGGAGANLLLPLGQTGLAFLRGGAWIGAGESGGLAWGGQIGVDWWLAEWLAIGPTLIYSADEGDMRGIQTLTGGAGVDFRCQWGTFMFSATPFVGVEGSKPGGHEGFGYGGSFLLGLAL